MPAPKLDAELVRRFGAAVSIGARPEQVARALGVGRSTYYAWIKRGVAPGPGDHLYCELVATIDRARGSSYVTLIGDLRNIAKRDPRAAMALLERIDKEWGAAGGDASAGSAAPTITFIVSGKEPKGPRGAAAPGESSGTRVIFDVGPQESAAEPSNPDAEAPEPSVAPYPKVVIDVSAKHPRRSVEESEAVAP